MAKHIGSENVLWGMSQGIETKKSCCYEHDFLRRWQSVKLRLDFIHLNTAIGAALLAHLMGDVVFAAVLAHQQVIEGQRVMRTALAGA